MIISATKKIVGPAILPYESMTCTIIAFQFSPVITMKIVINDYIVDENEYRDSLPSSSCKGLKKNCFASKADMNMKRIVKTPKLPIADIEFITVSKSFLRDTHDLMILKTLTSLKALNTERPELSALEKSSKTLTPTITASKMLKLSLKYFFIPRPNSFSSISHVKMTVKK